MRTLDLWLTELATEAAAELARRAARDTLSGVNERDHLQPSCTSAARAIARTWTPLPQVSTSFGFSSPMWPRVGRVDIALLLQDEKPIAVELKCGTGRDALGPCAWDALKLAFGLQAEEISAGYLLTATTTSDWAKQFRGAELFETTTVVDTERLRERFIDWWRRWERDGYPAATSVPKEFATRAICRVPFVIDRVQWEVRVAALHVHGTYQIPWPSTLAADASEPATR